jgi:hypothetical protein
MKKILSQQTNLIVKAAEGEKSYDDADLTGQREDRRRTYKKNATILKSV